MSNVNHFVGVNKMVFITIYYDANGFSYYKKQKFV